jgi:hypothetical protein
MWIAPAQPTFYLIRRIQPVNSQYGPSCQIVYSNTNKNAVEDVMNKTVAVSSLSQPYINYSIEIHPANISGRSLEAEYARLVKKRQLIEEAAVAAAEYNWNTDVEDVEYTRQTLEV